MILTVLVANIASHDMNNLPITLSSRFADSKLLIFDIGFIATVKTLESNLCHMIVCRQIVADWLRYSGHTAAACTIIGNGAHG
jgi:hypothetical protein